MGRGRQLNMMIIQMQQQLNEQRAQYAAEKQRAQNAAGAANAERAAQTARYDQLYTSNVEASNKAQANFESQLAETKKANEATLAGLNNLLLEQKAANVAQAEAFAKQTAAADARYADQVARSARLASAYIPDNQATASVPLVGDQRVQATAIKRGNQLSNLSIVSNPGQRNNGLSGLQIA